MPSPFPGMNPYLEHDHVFHGFHQDLCTEIKRAIVPQVRPNYIADTDVSIYIHEPTGEERLLGRPDVHVAEADRPDGTGRRRGGGATAVATPAVASAWLPTVDVVEIPFVKIMDRQTRRVVTVIEVLSRTNKVGDDRAAYLAKRNGIRRSDAHFIEIDLLRAGLPMPLETQVDAAYRVMLSRAGERPAVVLWPVRLRDRLPVVPVPLRAPDPDAVLDLQDVLHRVYDLGGYADHVYAHTPAPALHPEDAAWADGLIAGAARA